MLLQNCLFRVGGAAIILSNRRSDRSKALFKLKHCVRTHKVGFIRSAFVRCYISVQGSDQGSYESVYQEEDHEGNIVCSFCLTNIFHHFHVGCSPFQVHYEGRCRSFEGQYHNSGTSNASNDGTNQVFR